MSKIAVREKSKQARSTKPAKTETVVVDEEIAKVIDTPEAVVCVHRWRIETPNGQYSRGTCKVCGAEKEFPNSAEDGLWEREVPQSRWTGRTEWTPPSGSGF